MKAEVYTWRLSTQLKSDLEREARFRNISVSSVLDMAVRDWLKRNRATDDEEQRRIRAAAEKCLGAFASGNPHRAETARETIRQRLKQRYGR